MTSATRLLCHFSLHLSMPGSPARKHRANRTIPAAAKLPRRGLIGESHQIPCAKDFLDALHDRRQPRYLADRPSFLLARTAEPYFENPCAGGSIPPRATKNIVHATPTYASGRCRFWDAQSSAPVHSRCLKFNFAEAHSKISTDDGAVRLSPIEIAKSTNARC